MKTAEVKRIAIVGSGTMGARIAYQSALCGKQVNIYDIDSQAIARATSIITDWLEKKFDKEIVNEALARISPCTTLPDCLRDVQIVIENVPENLELKQKVFANLDKIAAPGTILATNSSSIPASRIAAATKRGEYILNVNFTNPTEDEYLVEVMFHEKTLPDVVASMENFLREIKCVPVVTQKEIMGFSFNRVWRAIKRENLHLVGDGYSHFEDLDRAWMLTFKTPWGPFGLMDLIGLDVIYDIEMVYYVESGEARDKPPAFLEVMIKSGDLGVKSGQGFYTYPNPAYKQSGWLTKEFPWSPEDTIRLKHRSP